MSSQVNKQITQPPIEFNLVDKNGKASTQFLDWLNALKPTLEASITNNRLAIPPVTTAQRDAITGVKNGMAVYNSDLHKTQTYENGVWKTITTT